MSLQEQMIGAVEAAVKVNDYDARSAIGMARSWVDNGKEIRWNPEQVQYENRDSLAKELVGLMEASEEGPEEQIEALQGVRAHVNAPYQSPEMLGFQARRAERGMIGSIKKNEKNK